MHVCIIRTAPIPGIGIGPIPGIGIRPIPGIGIRPIPAFFDDIGIGQVRYTSTNFCCLCIIIHKIVFFQVVKQNNKDKINFDYTFYSVSMYRYRYLYL